MYKGRVGVERVFKSGGCIDRAALRGFIPTLTPSPTIELSKRPVYSSPRLALEEYLLRPPLHSLLLRPKSLAPPRADHPLFFLLSPISSFFPVCFFARLFSSFFIFFFGGGSFATVSREAS